jgi:large repetitive protein
MIVLTTGTGNTVDFASGTSSIYNVETLVASSGNDTVTMTALELAGFRTIDLSTNADVLNITTSGTVDMTGSGGALALSSVEVVTFAGSANADTLTMSVSQLTALGKVDLGDNAGGSDVLNIVVQGAMGNLSTRATPTISNVETVTLSGSVGNDSVTISGDQLNAILAGVTGPVDFLGGSDTITLTSTSSALNNLADTSLLNLETITVSSGTGVTINLTNQTEGFTITGGSGADTITGNRRRHDRLQLGRGFDRRRRGRRPDHLC